jgi:hypothetical protein
MSQIAYLKLRQCRPTPLNLFIASGYEIRVPGLNIGEILGLRDLVRVKVLLKLRKTSDCIGV